MGPDLQLAHWLRSSVYQVEEGRVLALGQSMQVFVTKLLPPNPFLNLYNFLYQHTCLFMSSVYYQLSDFCVVTGSSNLTLDK